MAPKDAHIPIPGHVNMLPYRAKWAWQGVMKIRDLAMGETVLDYPGGPNGITGVFKGRTFPAMARERTAGNETVLVWKMEEGT